MKRPFMAVFLMLLIVVSMAACGRRTGIPAVVTEVPLRNHRGSRKKWRKRALLQQRAAL